MMFSMLEEWHQSGESQRDWCDIHEMNLSTFKYWYKKWQSSEASSFGSFREVTVKTVDSPSTGLTIYFPSGARMEFHTQPTTEQLSVLVNTL